MTLHRYMGFKLKTGITQYNCITNSDSRYLLPTYIIIYSMDQKLNNENITFNMNYN